jgi:hypothetical protein
MAHSHSRDEPCCPEFDRAPWDDKVHVWKDKPFIQESMPVFFHVPWPPMIGRLMSRMYGKAVSAGAAPEPKDVLALATDPTPWRTEWYMSVTKEVPDAKNVTLSGTFFTRVFDGPYNRVPKWIKEMDRHLAGEGKRVRRYFFHYTSCPKCAKRRGHNYVVGFAEIEEGE